MPTSVTYVGNSYSVPQYNDSGYAQGSGNLSSYLVALATGSLTLSGGAFALTSDANFGSSFGIISIYFKSHSSNIAASGVLRLASSDLIAWRNNANSADVQLTKNSSDNLNWPNGFIAAAFTSATANPATAGVIQLASGDAIEWRNNANSANVVLAKSAADALSYAGQTFLNSLGQVAAIVATLTSLTANAAASGIIRFASGDALAWRNNANSADLLLAKNASDQLTYGGTAIANSSGLLNSQVTGQALTSLSATLGTITTTDTILSAFGKVVNARIVQIVMATSTSLFTTTSSTFQATNLSGAIVLQSSSNKVLLFATGMGDNAANSKNIFATLARGGSNLAGTAGFANLSSSAGGEVQAPMSMAYLDSPATTGSVTYAVYIRNNDNAATVQWGLANLTQVLIMIEIGA